MRTWIVVALAAFFGWKEFLRQPPRAVIAVQKGDTITESEPYDYPVRMFSTEKYSLK